MFALKNEPAQTFRVETKYTERKKRKLLKLFPNGKLAVRNFKFETPECCFCYEEKKKPQVYWLVKGFLSEEKKKPSARLLLISTINNRLDGIC